ncbi:MAG: hypothetical protein NVS4B12_05720 [Ktedonobacteraceae bacterium]
MTRMSNVGTAIAKVAMLAGGAVLGAFLARLCDEWIASHSHAQSDYDRTRYAQGLGAVVLPPAAPPQAPFQAPNPEQQQYYE